MQTATCGCSILESHRRKRRSRVLLTMRSAAPAATPAYASCERLVQERPDVRDDIFSFSCIAYELLAGNHPFDRSSALKARKDGRKARRIQDLSRRQWAALESGLAWAREDRPANMRELLQGLALHSSAPAGTADPTSDLASRGRRDAGHARQRRAFELGPYPGPKLRAPTKCLQPRSMRSRFPRGERTTSAETHPRPLRRPPCRRKRNWRPRRP